MTNIKTVFPNYILQFRNRNTHVSVSLFKHIGHYRNCHRKPSMLKYRSLLLYFSSAILVDVIKCKVGVAFVTLFKI